VPELIAKLPLGAAPVTAGGVTLAEVALAPMTSVAPFNGKDKAVARALKAMGLRFPAPNTAVAQGGAEIIWTGRGQAFLIGPDPAPLAAAAALTDQTDGWAGFLLSGDGAAAVLARLVPVDCAAMAEGASVRTMLVHMNLILTRRADGFRMMVFRSMARAAWHEIGEAMHRVAARGPG
jgi:sarcosine oxidase subunit gamma